MSITTPSWKHKTCQGCLKKSDTKLLCCGRCQFAYYCNSECQRSDWKVHKALCKAAVSQILLNGEKPTKDYERWSDKFDDSLKLIFVSTMTPVDGNKKKTLRNMKNNILFVQAKYEALNRASVMQIEKYGYLPIEEMDTILGNTDKMTSAYIIENRDSFANDPRVRDRAEVGICLFSHSGIMRIKFLTIGRNDFFMQFALKLRQEDGNEITRRMNTGQFVCPENIVEYMESLGIRLF